jgi:hypothetical protein
MPFKPGSKLGPYEIISAVETAKADEELYRASDMRLKRKVAIKVFDRQFSESFVRDARADIFAYGAVLHEMITGKKAFEGKSRILLISAIATAEPEPLSSVKAAPLIATAFNETHGRISPDGKWIAYTSNSTGRNEIYVRPFPSGACRYQISFHGGDWPRWRRDGKELGNTITRHWFYPGLLTMDHIGVRFRS